MPRTSTSSAPRPRGRPRVSEPGTSVSTWLRTDDADKLMRLASKNDQTVSSVVRQILADKLR